MKLKRDAIQEIAVKVILLQLIRIYIPLYVPTYIKKWFSRKLISYNNYMFFFIIIHKKFFKNVQTKK